MKLQAFLLLIFAVAFTPAGGNPISTAEDIQVQENFDEERFYGKWYEMAVGSNCPWVKKYKDRYTMGTLVVAPGQSREEISMATTRLRQGVCSQITGVYQKTDIPGKFTYYNSRWDANIETFVVHTNYNEYAIFVTKKNSTHGLTTTAKIYGRSPELREDLMAEFRQLSLDLGIPEDSIFTLINKGECVPPAGESEPQPRVRRTTLFEEEGSADGSLNTLLGNKEDYCRLNMDAGPCLGSATRYFYNATSRTCETFIYGGCLGNGNNFRSEKACLQTCRTEASCRLPIVPGGPCKVTYWAFDANRGKCVTFEGCGGNGNKFYHEKECKEYCGIPSEGMVNSPSFNQ
ncbi:PREDICTED: complement component C8 gamma chain [Gekko japonicus]|uniref:Protein AMBP n=1 Tax=Gekko japonicus TaxID=146911 RepID=A0ABM1KEX8_GEKJA|nr:PREDICTED: complement component C8 gamma chain [Gekko japonicus]